ncbi:MAG TPA: hypothetical protein ENK00_01795, partial [Chromatiales bacterium]|nr:hypothetical protein [Chromatiales bacterium]
MEVDSRQNLSLVYSPHPLMPTRDRQVVSEPFLPGESIADYMVRVGVDFRGQPVVLSLNDRVVPMSEWSRTVPSTGDLISVRATVHDGGDGGSDAKRVILTIAVLVASYYTFGLVSILAESQLAGVVAAAAVSVAGTLLINKIAPLPGTELDSGENASPTYTLTGGSNQARPFKPLPLVIGTHRIFPDYGAKPYTEFQGQDQYLYNVFNFGLSDVTLSDYRIGETPIANFTDV